MKRFMLASVSLLALSAASAGAATFGDDGLTTLTVPATGTYDNTLFGAQGGASGTMAWVASQPRKVIAGDGGGGGFSGSNASSGGGPKVSDASGSSGLASGSGGEKSSGSSDNGAVIAPGTFGYAGRQWRRRRPQGRRRQVGAL